MRKSHEGKHSHKGYKHSDEAKRKISPANTGRKHTPETKEHLSKSLEKVGSQICIHYFYILHIL
jgi:hypothetical protein